MDKKKKTILITTISVVASVIVALSVGLGVYFGTRRDTNTPAISMNRYFASTATSTINGSPTTLPLSSFTGKKPSTGSNAYNKHSALIFSGELNWINSMYLECMYFYFYCNTTVHDLRLTVTITGLDGNITDPTLPEGTYMVQKVISINTKAGKGILARMDIAQTVNPPSKLSACDISFSVVKDDDVLSKYSNFKWTIYGLQVYGEHR